MESHDSEFARAGGYGLPGREDAMKAGHDAAVTTIIRQADAGMTPDQIADHSHDMSAWLLTEAETLPCSGLRRRVRQRRSGTRR